MPKSPRLAAMPSPNVGGHPFLLEDVCSVQKPAMPGDISKRVKQNKVAASVAQVPSNAAPAKKLKRKKIRKAPIVPVTETSPSVPETAPLAQPIKKKLKRKKVRVLPATPAPAAPVPAAATSSSQVRPAKKLKVKKVRKTSTAEASPVVDMEAAKPPPQDFPSKKEWMGMVKEAESRYVAPVKKPAKVVVKTSMQRHLDKEQEKETQVAAESATSPLGAPAKSLEDSRRSAWIQHQKDEAIKHEEILAKKNGVKRKAEGLDCFNKPIEAGEVADKPKQARALDGSAVVIRPAVSTPVQVLGGAAYRKQHDIMVTGTCPMPFETFESCECEFGEPLITALHLQSYTAPTPIQAQAWPIALRGQDMVAVAKTGSGKTCGFLLPALARLREVAQFLPKKGEASQPKVLVLAPTRELAQQIAGEAAKFAHVASCRVVALFGGVPKNEQVWQLEQGAEIVIATPGRLLDFTVGKPEKNQPPLVSLKNVNYLVLDEADRMLDMGFEPDIRKIIAQCPPSGRPEDHLSAGMSAATRQTLFFTATWPKAVQRTAASLVSSGAVQIRIGQGAGGDKLTANTDVVQTLSVIGEKDKLARLKEILEKELAQGESAFVFAKTRHTCDYLEKQLWDEKEDLSIGTWCRAIHSHREQWERDANLATFRSITLGKDNGRRGILVATDVAARGLDIPGVTLVVVYDFGGGNLGENSGVESYVHRIGRTGRAGMAGKAFTFFTEHDTGAYALVKLLDEAKQRVPYELRAMAEKRGKGGKGSGKDGKGGKGGKGKGKGKGKSKGGGGKGKSKGGKGGKSKGY